MSDKMPAAEGELEAFRNEWRAEVSARTTRQLPLRQGSSNATQRPDRRLRSTSTTASAEPRHTPKLSYDVIEDLEPKSFHDLPDKEEQSRLSVAGQGHNRDAYKEPTSALEHYERAVEKEGQGQLGDSLKHYRKAFKLDDDVHELYKKKHFPAQARAQKQTSNATSIPSARQSQIEELVPLTLQDVVKSYSTSRIEAPPPPTDASPEERCPVGDLPEEIIAQILTYVAVADVATMAKVSTVCKRMAYLVMTEETVWKAVSLKSRYGFADMIYRFACNVEGTAFDPGQERDLSLADFESGYSEARMFAQKQTTSDAHALLARETTQKLLASRFAGSWRQMFRSRPRIRFNGCYISTVNYTRAGGADNNTLSWGVPVHVVTYYRYLRFFRDGSVISLLTTAEPKDVVHHLIKGNMHHQHGSVLPSAVMKDALHGRWRLTGPSSGSSETPEDEGEILIEAQGKPRKYIFEMRLAFGNAGKTARNNKLAWKSYDMRNRLTDDSAPFTLKHEKGFYWSRVRSFA